MSRANLTRLVVLAGIWGSSFLWIELALGGLAPVQIVIGRLWAGATVLAVLVAVQGRRLPREPAMWGHLALLGVVSNIVPFFLFGWGQQYVTSGLAGVLNGTTPLFTLSFALAALPEERLALGRAAGLLIGFAGVVLVVGPWDQNPLTSSIPGQLACLAAAACYGVGIVYTRRFVTQRGYATLTLAAVQLSLGALILGAVGVVVGRTPVSLTPTVVSSVLVLGAVGTGLAYALYVRLIAEAGATSTSMVTYLVPLVAVAIGVVVLGEPLTWNVFAGALVVILGVAIAEGRVRLPGPATSPPGPATSPPGHS